MGWNRRAAFGALLAALFASRCVAAGEPGAIVLVYHHVSAEAPPSTSVTPEQFAAHLDYIADNDFDVVPLWRIVEAFENGEPLSPRTVAITFDDAYASVHDTAMPMLSERGWPFTVFVATNAIDGGLGGYMSWDALRAIVANGGDVQNHSAAHEHLVRRRGGESEAAWRRRILEDLQLAQHRIDTEIGRLPSLFAYPYGEYDAALAALVREAGLVGIGQHSGAAHAGTLAAALPRFPVNRAYAELSTLGDKLHSLPLPVTRRAPDDGVLRAGDVRPELIIELADPALAPGGLTCFVAGQPPASITWRGRVATIRARGTLAPGRSKYNCTMPSREQPGRYHWQSFLWMLPNADGSWYAE